MRTFFATCAPGLEEVVAGELGALDVEHVRPGRGRVTFHGDLAAGYAACLWLRAASRVQEQLFRDRPAGSRQQLYDAVRGFDWGPVIDPGCTLAVSVSQRDGGAADPRFVGQVTKDAIVDQLRERHGDRPDVDPSAPDVPVRVVIRGGKATVSRDLAGEPLHRRGWRPVQVKSPLNEAVAAGLLALTGWTAEQRLLDPMCGSGTFLVEAAHRAQDRAPGLRRSFAFERWPDLERPAWQRLRDDAEQRFARGRDVALRIAGADHHAGALSIAGRSLQAAELKGRIELHRSALSDGTPPWTPELVVANPPWGVRLGDEDVERAWTDLGRFLKAHCGGATAYLLSGDAALTRPLKMRAARRHPVRIGPVDARWVRYEVLPPRASAPRSTPRCAATPRPARRGR